MRARGYRSKSQAFPAAGFAVRIWICWADPLTIQKIPRRLNRPTTQPSEWPAKKQAISPATGNHYMGELSEFSGLSQYRHLEHPPRDERKETSRSPFFSIPTRKFLLRIKWWRE